MTDNEDRVPKVEETSPTEAPSTKDGWVQATLTGKDGKSWLLYLRGKDEIWGKPNRGLLAAYGPRTAATEYEAAVHLLATTWRDDPDRGTAGIFHEVHGEGFLTENQLEEIGQLVDGESSS